MCVTKNQNRYSGKEASSEDMTRLMRGINRLEVAVFQTRAYATLDRKYPAANSLRLSYLAILGNEIYTCGSTTTGGVGTIYVFNLTTETLSRSWTINAMPRGVFVDPSTSEIYIVCDPNFGTTPKSQFVSVFNTVGVLQRAWGGTVVGTGDGEFTGIGIGRGLVHSGEVYICDGNNRVQVFTTSGTFVRKFGSAGSGDGEFNQNVGIVLIDGELFVSDALNNRIQVFSTAGVYDRQFTANQPTRFAHRNDKLYVVRGADLASTSKIIYVYTVDGAFLGTFELSGYTNYLVGEVEYDAVDDELHVANFSAPVTITNAISVFDPVDNDGVQTVWYHVLNDGQHVLMGNSDGGISVPATHALSSRVPQSELEDDQFVDENPRHYILQMRRAIQTIVEAAVILNPKTGAAFNFNHGDTTNNVYYVAMNSRLASYGLDGATLYFWSRPLGKSVHDFHDIDIGEIEHILAALTDAATTQGLF